ncbi:hypothetical protein HZH68_007476 [Vespula germanica]|uniref:Uncharacterized protein n=1 Tax=Vespula germanica TaxID=30212 RepID=A0A834KD21_VESGE|nr:hypothetical protein HZH68_007476 [Vespula germanica]
MMTMTSRACTRDEKGEAEFFGKRALYDKSEESKRLDRKRARTCATAGILTTAVERYNAKRNDGKEYRGSGFPRRKYSLRHAKTFEFPAASESPLIYRWISICGPLTRTKSFRGLNKLTKITFISLIQELRQTLASLKATKRAERERKGPKLCADDRAGGSARRRESRRDCRWLRQWLLTELGRPAGQLCTVPLSSSLLEPKWRYSIREIHVLLRGIPPRYLSTKKIDQKSFKRRRNHQGRR